MITKVIDNFKGALTRNNNGDMNSGLAKFGTTYGNDPFSSPSDLTWMENPTQIASGVITDLVMAAKTRLESGITYVYAIGHTGRLYKIQVNNPSTQDPDYDTAVLLTTLTSNSPTFKYSASIEFYGSTEKIFLGGDVGVTKVNFDGTGETFVGVVGSYTQNVARPSASFLGKLYFGNGNNLVEIDSTETVTSYTKLNPSFPSGTYVRDLDVSPDGNYLQAVVSRIPSPDMSVITQDTTALSSSNSYIFLWNGTDNGYTSYTTYNSHSLTSNIVFGQNNYTAGYDSSGAALYSGSEKVLTLPQVNAPNFNAMFSTGNMVGFGVPEFRTGGATMEAAFYAFGNYDYEYQKSLYRLFRSNVGDEGGAEAVQMPMALIVSNLFYGPTSSAYTGNEVGVSKMYFSLLGNNSGSPSYAFYRFYLWPTGLSYNTPIEGIYETQSQLFEKRVWVKNVRIYSETTWNTDNGPVAFDVDIVDANGNTLDSKSFSTLDGTIEFGTNYALWTPSHEPSSAIGFKISNIGTSNYTIVKVELDIDNAGI